MKSASSPSPARSTTSTPSAPPASRARARRLWHAEHDLRGVDAVVLPGGFSYGDYLRAGAIAARAPIMDEVVAAADRGMPVLGICNGFQILCEAGLLPGALTRNDHRTSSAATSGCASSPPRRLDLVVRRGRRRSSFRSSTARAATSPTRPPSTRLESDGRVVFRYVDDNPNGSMGDIAGIASANGNVVGLMPHPEHAIDPLTGSLGGRARPVHLGAHRCRLGLTHPRVRAATPQVTPATNACVSGEKLPGERSRKSRKNSAGCCWK